MGRSPWIIKLGGSIMKKGWILLLMVGFFLVAGFLSGVFAAETGKSSASATSLKGSQTEKNLLAAFAGESQARNRYTYYADAAKEEGLEQIAAIFLETADNEKEHAEIFFKLLQGGDIAIAAAYPSHFSEQTLPNLEAAAAGERAEWTMIYQNFAQVAKDEGFGDVATAFSEVAKVEKWHEKRYRALIDNVQGNKVFQKDQVVTWHCRNCGYVLQGKAAPMFCAACKAPQGYFELLAENY
jgi:rubrerythrin